MKIQDYHYEQLEFLAERTIQRFTLSAMAIGIDVSDPDWMDKVMNRPEILLRMQPLTPFEVSVLTEKTRRDTEKLKKHLSD
jgi:hypothetical protein